MVGERGGADGNAVAHVGAGALAPCPAEALKDIVAAWVGQGAGDEAELAVGESYLLCGSHVTTLLDASMSFEVAHR